MEPLLFNELSPCASVVAAIPEIAFLTSCSHIAIVIEGGKSCGGEIVA